MEDVFTDFYARNRWGSPESRSGKGSTLVYTQRLRRELPVLLDDLGVRTLVDVPCGDFHWMSRVIPLARELRAYIGGDIVRDLVEQNRARNRAGNVTFEHLDITRDSIPPGDLLLCRDCLFHFPYADILRALENFLVSQAPWLLTSTHPRTTQNQQVRVGGFFELNLEIPPWNLPPPAAAIDDWVPGFPERHLGLWHRVDIARAVREVRW